MLGQRLRLDGLGQYQAQVEQAMKDCEERNLIARIWAGDHTIWKPEPTEIANRLGWLRSPEVMSAHCEGLAAFARDLHDNGYTRFILLGMGGSSLAPEVFHRTFGDRDDALRFGLVDSTDPDTIARMADSIDPLETIFIVSTKSGGTIETLSLFKHFHDVVRKRVGPERAGRHFVMITDPGSSLIKLGEEQGFRAAFLNDPEIGGRYSALSYFGLVPAALMGIDTARVLASASSEVNASGGQGVTTGAPIDALTLGVALGELARAGRDKATFVISESIAGFGDWVEQLIAESTGKEGTGILPVVGEGLGEPGVYGPDRVFIQISIADDDPGAGPLQKLHADGHPVIRVRVEDVYDLGSQFFLWELATAVAGYRLGINPFDQPNVESAKVRAREMMVAYEKDGALPIVRATWEKDGVAVYATEGSADPATSIAAFLKGAPTGAYVGIQAYIESSAEMDRALARLRHRLRDRYHLTTTVGYGPRFLHSTGQLHKGDAGKGQFIQITGGNHRDVPIPDEPGSDETSATFGTLKAAQALGDRQALIDAGRRVLRLHYPVVTPEIIDSLADQF